MLATQWPEAQAWSPLQVWPRASAGRASGASEGWPASEASEADAGSWAVSDVRFASLASWPVAGSLDGCVSLEPPVSFGWSAPPSGGFANFVQVTDVATDATKTTKAT